MGLALIASLGVIAVTQFTIVSSASLASGVLFAMLLSVTSRRQSTVIHVLAVFICSPLLAGATLVSGARIFLISDTVTVVETAGVATLALGLWSVGLGLGTNWWETLDLSSLFRVGMRTLVVTSTALASGVILLVSEQAGLGPTSLTLLSIETPTVTAQDSTSLFALIGATIGVWLFALVSIRFLIRALPVEKLSTPSQRPQAVRMQGLVTKTLSRLLLAGVLLLSLTVVLIVPALAPYRSQLMTALPVTPASLADLLVGASIVGAVIIGASVFVAAVAKAGVYFLRSNFEMADLSRPYLTGGMLVGVLTVTVGGQLLAQLVTGPLASRPAVQQAVGLAREVVIGGYAGIALGVIGGLFGVTFTLAIVGAIPASVPLRGGYTSQRALSIGLFIAAVGIGVEAALPLAVYGVLAASFIVHDSLSHAETLGQEVGTAASTLHVELIH
ncbi:hypothetical protein, partial [Haloferax profundi]|uniref:hypothetical protein n=1 Tax=Haloferax profundi TaxID=1544718 RepID=UPI0018D23C22